MAKTPKSASTKAAQDITNKTGREALAPRKAPYYHRMYENHFVGFRILAGKDGKRAEHGAWVAKIQHQGGETTTSFGKLLEVADTDRFKVASEMAVEWFKGNGTIKLDATKMSLQDVLAAYTENLRTRVRVGAKPDSAEKAARWVEARVACVVRPFFEERGLYFSPVQRLTGLHFKHWRQWLIKEPTVASAGMKAGRARSLVSVNRDLAMMSAALNMAHKDHGIPKVWQEALAKDLDAEKAAYARARNDNAEKVLTIAQRKALVAACETVNPAFVPFIKIMLTVPVRPGALALVTKGDYRVGKGNDGRFIHWLHIRFDKVNGERNVYLPTDAGTMELLQAAKRGKTDAALLFPDAEGKPWDAFTWGEVMREASKVDKSLKGATVYDLRHTRLTQLVQLNIDPLALASLAGTSVKMLQDTYYKPQGEHLDQFTSVRAF